MAAAERNRNQAEEDAHGPFGREGRTEKPGAGWARSLPSVMLIGTIDSIGQVNNRPPPERRPEREEHFTQNRHLDSH